MKLTRLDFLLEFSCRLIVALTFLSAVADRLGFWGNYGDSQVVWGNFNIFLNMVAQLCFWAPKSLIPFLGYAATFLEAAFGILLIFKIKVREVALASALLFLTFSVAMVTSGYAKSMIDHSALCAMAASLFIYYINSKPATLNNSGRFN